MARVSAIRYRETIWSELYPGNRLTLECVQPAVEAAEIAFGFSPAQRQRVVWRLDGGAGSDAQIVWLLGRGYQVVAKGMSHRRAEALARQVQRWDAYQDVWLGEVVPPMDYGRKVRVWVKRRLKNGAFAHSYYLTSLSLPSKAAFMAGYNGRGGAEVEQFRADKGGLGLEIRRKHRFGAQQGCILLADIAHNLLADFYSRALMGSRFEGFGVKRIVRDVLAMPGRLVFADHQLVRVELLSQKQFAQDLALCLEKYCSST